MYTKLYFHSKLREPCIFFKVEKKRFLILDVVRQQTPQIHSARAIDIGAAAVLRRSLEFVAAQSSSTELNNNHRKQHWNSI